MLTTATVGPELVGKVARLRKWRTGASPVQRVRVTRIIDLGWEDGRVMVVGDLLYSPSNTAYGPRDSRGVFTSLAYVPGETVETEEGS
ncbi:hypothetical protein [Phycicoccus sp.]|uniref:hypothetical protein n=1 Tax=Phycicoccus sp. TaxID=1902410 RepID=UPI002B52723F|nr:hypothetical protein [Phycicoccus sp.]HMM95324.1 hypothetical protein [Phycicoccus sp.]